MSSLSSRLSGQMVLAPLTRGGNLPFRRLCAEFGAEVTLGEMIFARQLLKGDVIERARLRRASNEQVFGVQIATNDVEEGVGAAKLAAAAGADWVDLNCGCPIHEATRRGLGSAMLRQPVRLERLVRGIAAGSPLPVSVKVRLASEGGDVNVREVVGRLRAAGAAAVTIHGRTAEARYSKAADWRLIAECVEDNAEAGGGMPLLGNGDLLTQYEAHGRMAQSGVDGVMVGRGALIKPWIFKEFRDRRAWEPSAAERVAVYRQLACFMKEHFGDDAKGRRKAWYFLPWHFDFLSRYRPLPEEEFGERAAAAPLMQTRVETCSKPFSEPSRSLPIGAPHADEDAPRAGGHGAARAAARARRPERAREGGGGALGGEQRCGRGGGAHAAGRGRGARRAGAGRGGGRGARAGRGDRAVQHPIRRRAGERRAQRQEAPPRASATRRAHRGGDRRAARRARGEARADRSAAAP